jgi:hypothetical protein
MWDPFFHLPKGFIFQTVEERAFLARRFPSLSLPDKIAGIGIECPVAAAVCFTLAASMNPKRVVQCSSIFSGGSKKVGPHVEADYLDLVSQLK